HGYRRATQPEGSDDLVVRVGAWAQRLAIPVEVDVGIPVHGELLHLGDLAAPRFVEPRAQGREESDAHPIRISRAHLVEWKVVGAAKIRGGMSRDDAVAVE